MKPGIYHRKREAWPVWLALLFWALMLALIFGFTSCASPRHFAPPSAVKLNAAVTHVERAAAESKHAVSEARESAKRSVVITGSLKAKVLALLKVTPPELRAQVLDIQADVLAQEVEQRILTEKIASAEAKQGTLEKAITELKTEKTACLANTQKIVDKANTDSEAWAKDRKSLWGYRLHRFASWLIFSAGVILCGLLAFLKSTGRIAVALRPIP